MFFHDSNFFLALARPSSFPAFLIFVSCVLLFQAEYLYGVGQEKRLLTMVFLFQILPCLIFAIRLGMSRMVVLVGPAVPAVPVLENEDIFDLAIQDVTGDLKMMKKTYPSEPILSIGSGH